MPAHVSPGSSGSLFSHLVAETSLATPIRVAVVALAVSLTAVAAQFAMPLPFTPVPFVLTPLVVLLSGAALGSRLGAITQVLYVLVGVLGVPVFAPSVTLPPGALRLFGPTGGYLMAYPIAAFAAGWLAERGWDRRYLSSAAAMLIGLAIIFVGGVSWLAVSVTHSLPAAIGAGFVVFAAFDVIKVLAAAAILPRVWRAIGSSGHRAIEPSINDPMTR
jgi:biotin transport system substrate-specific component